ncbi:FtsX-like permease family protein [Clostridium sp. YIM B02551]|uniref:FtsX-like permease family protein n=1 Tax=Clostridium sp. YIM B02551 TaxID=2910679 RepID=UPI001EEA295C|nr:FtsX-like permease family protein [Clostridium sp. YIM B02551]
MQVKSYKKSIIREIASSKARFTSILVIIFLGVSFYSGIKSTGPDMKKSINRFYSNQNLMDSKIVSSLGLTDKDLDILKNNDRILDYFGTHSIDAGLTNVNSVVRFMEYDPQNTINNLIISEGRLPENSGEIALDEKALKQDKNLKIGDKYVIETDKDTMDSFKKTTFKIVGFVRSPMYVDNEARGTTTVGKGSIDYFAVLNKSDISMDVYTEIYVRFKNVQNVDTYSNEYKDKMEQNNEYIQSLYSKRSIDRIDEVKKDAQKEFDKAYKEIEDGENKLSNAQKEIDDGKDKLEAGKKQYAQGVKDYEQKIKAGEDKLADGQKQLENGQIEINKQKEKLAEGEEQLNGAKTQLDSAKEKFLAQGINPDQDTSNLKNQLSGLKTLIQTYDALSKDINDTVSSTQDGDMIPTQKIQYWKTIISQPGLGLEGLKGLIDQLVTDQSNKTLALSISKGVDAALKSANENATNLETLINGITSYQQGKAQYEEQLKVLNGGKLQIDAAQKQLDASKIEITNGKKELEAGKAQGKLELDKAQKQLVDSEKKLIDGEKELEQNKQKLLDARKEVDENKEKLKDLDKSKYYFFDRNDNPGYGVIKDSIKSLDNIASVFPVFFFLVAVLICLTTMTRMVEENRIEIGTLKALGYSDLEISEKFVVYAALASIIGGILGILVGCTALPSIINSAYGMLFVIPKFSIYFYPSYIIQSMAASILCTVGAVLFVLEVELKNNPSDMMRPKAPKLGKKILLERITPLWKRLNFNQKVTLRNLFRYKQRMIMTVLGIAGCMAMLVTGFALQSSNKGVLDRQFNKLWHYQAMVIFKDDVSEKDSKEYDDILKGLKGYNSSLNIHQESVTFTKENMNKQTATMYVPEDVENFDKFVTLRDRVTEKNYKISDDGVIINEKLAKLLKVSSGDTIVMKDEDNNSYNVKVSEVAENYLMHSIYISPAYYEKIFSKKPIYNAQFLKLKSDAESDDEISSKLMESNKVINVTLTSKIIDSSKESANSLNLVMVVIILASGSLAFVVLYNLNNINVSERIRELSTIKVLGFFDNEVTMYILRENVILTLLGVLVGSFMGKILYSFIIGTAETDTMMMLPDVFMRSYVFSALITILFSLLVMIMMHIKLRNVNMIDALKSNE